MNLLCGLEGLLDFGTPRSFTGIPWRITSERAVIGLDSPTKAGDAILSIQLGGCIGKVCLLISVPTTFKGKL